MSLATGYKISMTLESESLNAYYGGSFIIQAELDSTLAVDLFYQFAGMDGDAAPYADDDLNESEPRNNNASTPDNLLSSRTMVAKTNKDDVDYFRFYCPPNMTGSSDDDEIDYSGMVNIEFILTIGEFTNIQMECYDGNGNMVREPRTLLCTFGMNVLYFKINNANRDTSYKIKITSSNTSEVSYRLKVSYEYKLAWFGQYVSKDGDGEYWNSAPIEKLEIKYNADKKPLFKENSSFIGDEAWMTQSCGIVGAAMILNNINAKANVYDFRTGISKDVLADPYTATLANCQYYISGNTTTYTVTNGKNPRALNEVNLSNAFGVKYVRKDGAISEASLKQMIQNYEYVLVWFNSAHFMVVTEIKSGSEDFKERAIVYDPAAKTYSAGANVKLSETRTGFSGMSEKNITRVYAFYH